uniref:Uncharacterized protein n=1 Tax=Lactuca sativa TaxID=4236 RepID=A0A9R1VJR3_LACSA|nr:hypothetical protein LSAT_V11C500278230 [Lactuca sativa]
MNQSLTKENEASLFSEPSISSNPGVHRTISEGQFPVMASLSDTLEAAWTSNLQKDTTSVLSDSDLTKSSLLEKGVKEQCRGTKTALVSPVFSNKGSEMMEDSTSWLGMPW